jgi:signal transduction histidine kinase
MRLIPWIHNMARLEVLEGNDRGQSFLLTGDEMFLGRSPDNSIYLSDNRISRRHALLVRKGAHFSIEDLNSTNGVILRGKRIPPRTPCDLADGDEIWISSTRLVLHAEEPTAEGTGERDTSPPPPEVAPALEPTYLMQAVGPLTLEAPAYDAESPTAFVSLDASVNMAKVQDNEKHTDTGLQEALTRLQALGRVSAALGAINNLDALMLRIIGYLFELFPAAERALLMLHTENDDELVPVIAKQRQETPDHQDKVVISRTIVNMVVQQKRSILSVDTQNDSRFKEHMSAFNFPIRSVMCAPLLVGDEILGVVQVDASSGPNAFAAEDLQLLTGISNQSAVAIKNLRLIEASQAKSYFLANMSHELRTPLNAIIGYSEMMLEDEAENQGECDRVADLQKIYIAGKHLLALINNILDLSKIEAGKMNLELETFEVAPMIQEVAWTIKPLVTKNANILKIQVADEVSTMHADMLKVRQILLNLISNACKFTEKGTITLDVARYCVNGSERLTFRVIDTGIGMTPEQLAKLFRPFTQASVATSRQYGGTGLGLTICQRFCQMMGGNLTVDSTLGEGSAFTFWLPTEVSTPMGATSSDG